MKNSLVILILLLMPLAASRFADGILARLGLKEQEARTFILRNMIGRFSTSPVDEGDLNLSDDIDDQVKGFQIPVVPLLASIVSGDKKTAAHDLCEYVKAYVNSPQFRADYQQAREAARPESEQAVAEHYATMKEAVKGMEEQYAVLKAAKQVPEAALTEFEKTIAQMKVKLAAQEDPMPHKTRWDRLYPEDPAVMVRARLNEYLETLATVDFSAKLTGTSAKNLKFANPVYEKKSLKWKAIYRAGKDVNDVAAVFAREWLKGEITSK